MSKVVTTKITATSRAAIKIRDNFYTVEFSEERTVLDADTADLSEERQALFDTVNLVVDTQCADIIKTFQ